jgi:hypothetical protein
VGGVGALVVAVGVGAPPDARAESAPTPARLRQFIAALAQGDRARLVGDQTALLLASPGGQKAVFQAFAVAVRAPGRGLVSRFDALCRVVMPLGRSQPRTLAVVSRGIFAPSTSPSLCPHSYLPLFPH